MTNTERPAVLNRQERAAEYAKNVRLAQAIFEEHVYAAYDNSTDASSLAKFRTWAAQGSADSRAAKELLFEDWRGFAMSSISSIGDACKGLAALCDAEVPGVTSPLLMARLGLETAARLNFLCPENAENELLAARILSVRSVQEFEEEKQIRLSPEIAALVQGESTAKKPSQPVSKIAALVGLGSENVKRGNPGALVTPRGVSQPLRPSSTELVMQLAKQTPIPGHKTDLAFVWRSSSGATHGMPWLTHGEHYASIMVPEYDGPMKSACIGLLDAMAYLIDPLTRFFGDTSKHAAGIVECRQALALGIYDFPIAAVLADLAKNQNLRGAFGTPYTAP